MNSDADFSSRKRKNCLLTLPAFNARDDDDNNPDDDLTKLSLSFRPSRQRIPSPTTQTAAPLQLHPPLDLYSIPSQPLPPPPPVPREADASPVPMAAPITASRGRGRRRASSTAVREAARNETITPPYPWAMDRRAMVHSLDYLVSRRILMIRGMVQCKKCEKTFEMEYDLKQKFYEVGRYIAENKTSMRDRAPPAWMNPVLPRCKLCDQENCAKPVFPPDKDGINWLFLLLGQMVGCCTLDQLKYFCEHTKNHRTGAKDRIVYYTYLGLCKQLDPEGPFDP